MPVTQTPEGRPFIPFEPNTHIGGLTTPPFATAKQADNTVVANDSLNLVVWGDSIHATLPKRLKYAPFAEIGNTLVGVPGSTIGFTTFDYIGPAVSVNERQPVLASEVSVSTKYYQIENLAKSIRFTEQQMLHDGSLVDQALGQFSMSFADKLDNDILDIMQTAMSGGTLNLRNLDSLSDASVLLSEDIGETKYLLLNRYDFARLQAYEPLAIHIHPANTENGGDGLGGFTVFGMRVITGDKTPRGKAFLLKSGAIRVEYGQHVSVKSDVDVTTDEYVFVARSQYVVFLKDASRIVQFDVIAEEGN